MPRPATPAAAASEVEATIATIAELHLGLQALKGRGSRRFDVQGHSRRNIRAALHAAFVAGMRASGRPVGAAPVAAPTVIQGDLVLTSPVPADGCGDWVRGRIGAFRFCAKVYPEHAVVPAYEIGRSRISKLELRRLDTGTVAYAWDRGLDIPATDAAAQEAVDRLAKHLAHHLYGPAPR
jgi:hypothetical protein